jgi:nuclease HARBI1
VSRVEALCILLNRISCPSRLEVMETTFGKSFSVISRIVNSTTDLVLNSLGHLLSISPTYVSEERVREWMEAVRSRGAPFKYCFGFLDGTVRPICRPSRFQKQAYNGHKRVHALKLQSLSAPDGLIVDLTGPWEGRRHDCGMLRESGLLSRLEEIQAEMGPAYVYGDPAYPVSAVLQAHFKGSSLTEQQNEWNVRMSRVRISVEWCFGKELSFFPFVDFKTNLKIHLQPVGSIYSVAVLLTNMQTCMKGSVTTSFFGLKAPELEFYLTRPQPSSTSHL